MSAPSPNPARERHWVCAQRMRERRLALGLTQRDVVGRLQRRGHQTTNRALSAMENGRGLDLGLLPDLAGSLDCTVTYLLGLAADPRSWRPDQSAWVRPDERPQAAADRPAPERSLASGVLGPDIPNGFAAPGRLRRRAAAVERAGADPAALESAGGESA
jgi:transcriptional regulator with XRE-family HTH domain